VPRLIEGHVTQGWREAWARCSPAGRNGSPTGLDPGLKQHGCAAAGQPEAEAACAELAPDRDGLEDLHIALAATWTTRSGSAPASCAPDPAPREAASPARILRNKRGKGARFTRLTCHRPLC
jgi:hypothetical protein